MEGDSSSVDLDEDHDYAKRKSTETKNSIKNPALDVTDKTSAVTNSASALPNNEDSSVLDCPVCLQACIYPVQLPCRHIFCFLCVKGVASRSKRCALCRQQIPPDFFCRPNLVRRDDLEQPVTFDDGYGWFYEGVNGWWQYDDRTSTELEGHHKAGHTSCELLIAGYVYIIDLTNMVQSRRNNRRKKRRIKRDLINLAGRKGVAGLKIYSNVVVLDSDRPGAYGHETGTESNSSTRQTIPIQQADRSGDDQSLSPPTPYNTPQTPMTPPESPPSTATTERDLSVHLERLRLVESVPMSISAEDDSNSAEYDSNSAEDDSNSAEDDSNSAEDDSNSAEDDSNSSSRGYDTPELLELLSSSMEDATRLENVSARLQRLQWQVSPRGRLDGLDEAEDPGENSDCETSGVQV